MPRRRRTRASWERISICTRLVTTRERRRRQVARSSLRGCAKVHSVSRLGTRCRTAGLKAKARSRASTRVRMLISSSHDGLHFRSTHGIPTTMDRNRRFRRSQTWTSGSSAMGSPLGSFATSFAVIRGARCCSIEFFQAPTTPRTFRRSAAVLARSPHSRQGSSMQASTGSMTSCFRPMDASTCT